MAIQATDNKALDTGAVEKKRRTAKSYATELAVKIMATVLAVWILCTFIIGIFVCHDRSNYPMIKDGDLCVTSRHSRLKKGDAAVWPSKKENRFSRTAAVENDVVTVENGTFYVNGYAVEGGQCDDKFKGKISYPYTVPKGSVFMLNDDRSDMNDSRSFGAVPLKKVKGKVIFIMRRRDI